MYFSVQKKTGKEKTYHGSTGKRRFLQGGRNTGGEEQYREKKRNTCKKIEIQKEREGIDGGVDPGGPNELGGTWRGRRERSFIGQNDNQPTGDWEWYAVDHRTLLGAAKPGEPFRQFAVAHVF